jgi:hypothetical protein
MPDEIALVSGNGVGKVIVPEGAPAIQALAGRFGRKASFAAFPYSCPYDIGNGIMFPPGWTGRPETVGHHPAGDRRAAEQDPSRGKQAVMDPVERLDRHGAPSMTGGRVNPIARIAGPHTRGHCYETKRLVLRKADFKR